MLYWLLVISVLLISLKIAYSFILNYLSKKVWEETIVFNCVWEDPHIDKQALNIVKDESVICTITSAGCNVLSLALESPKHIYAIDLNPCQNALLELKIAAIREFDYEQCWQLFGTGRLNKFSKVWYPRLRQHLTPASRAFWDKNANFFDGNGGLLGRNSFYYHGCTGILAYAVVKIYFRLLGLTGPFNDIIHADTLEEQRKIYETRIKKRMWNPVLRWLISSKTAMSLLNGVPSAQQKLLEEEGGAESVGKFIQEALEEVLLTLPLKNNYFYRVYIENGQYSKDCCPDYLIKKNFKKLKENRLIDRISIHTTTVEEFLKNHKSDDEEVSEPLKDIDTFILLDHMDWMSSNENRKLLESEWQQILDHSKEEGCRYLYRSASKEANFVKETKVSYQGNYTTVAEVLQWDSLKANKLHKLDRVHTYTSFFIADLKL